MDGGIDRMLDRQTNRSALCHMTTNLNVSANVTPWYYWSQ